MHQIVRNYHPAPTQSKVKVGNTHSTKSPLMGYSPPSNNIGPECDSAATLGLDNLKLDSETSVIQQPWMLGNKKSGTSRASGVASKNEPSKLAARSWRLNPQAPDYQPMNILPLGSIGLQHSKGIEIVRHESLSQVPNTYYGTVASGTKENLHQSTLPSRGKFKQKTKQSVLYSREKPPWRTDRLHRYPVPPSPPPPSRPCALPAKILPSQPLGRWFGSAPTIQPRTGVHSSLQQNAVKSPPTPTPSASYITQSSLPATKQPLHQPLLLVLDLNGTLLFRPRSSTGYQPRPSLLPFLAHCITNYKVLVWSSATPHNVTAICSKIFTPEQRKLLLGEWGRDTLGLTQQQYNAKVQVYKRLDRIWSMDRIQRSHPGCVDGGRWSQKNTLLLDDSALKASAQPYNAVVVPEFVKGGGAEQTDGIEVLGQVLAYLETAKTFEDVSSFARVHPFRINEGWSWDWALKEPLVVDLAGEGDEKIGGPCP